MKVVKQIAIKIGRIIAVSVITAFLLFVFVSFAISLPPVQTQAVCWAKDFLGNKLGIEIEIEAIDIGLPSNAILEGVQCYDQSGEKVLSIKALHVDLLTFSLWKYIRADGGLSELNLNYIELIEPEFYLYKRPDGTNNLDFLRSEKKKKEEGGSKLVLHFPEIQLVNGSFRFVDSTKAAVDSVFQERINFANLQVENIRCEAAVDIYPNNKLQVNLTQLSLREQFSGFFLERLSTRFYADTVQLQHSTCYEDEQFLDFKNLELIAGQTHLKADVHMPGQTLAAFGDSVADERFSIQLKASQIGFATISYFLEKPLPLRDHAVVNGLILGTLDRIVCHDFEGSFGDQSTLNADLLLEHVLDKEKLNLDISLRESQVSFAELQHLITELDLPVSMLNMTPLQFAKGSFLGHYRDFVASAEVDNEIGKLSGEVHLILPSKAGIFTYEGSLTTQNLNLDTLQLFDDPISSNLSATAQISGRGIRLSELNTSVMASIRRSDLLGYMIDSLDTRLTVSENVVFGGLQLTDPQGSADMILDVDIAHKPGTVRLDGNVSQLDLRHYGVIDQKLAFSSDVNVDLLGDSLDNVRGSMRLLETQLIRNEDSIEVFNIPQFSLSSDLDPSGSGQRLIELKSSLLDAVLDGNFNWTNLADLTSRLLKESQLYFANNDSLTKAYYENKMQLADAQEELNVNFELISQENINDIFQFLRQPIYLTPMTSVIGTLDFGMIESAEISVLFDSTAYDMYNFKNGLIVLDFIKDALSDYTLLEAEARTYTTAIGSGILLDSMVAEVELSEGKMKSKLFADQQNLDNLLKLEALSVFESNGSISNRIDSAASWLKVNEYFWRFNPDHEVVMSGDQIEIVNYKLYSREQQIMAEGLISDEVESELNVEIDDLNMSLLSELANLGYAVDGLLNLDIEVAEVLGDPKITANGRLNHFSLDQYLYGDLLIESFWDRPKSRIQLDARLVHQDASKILLQGAYKLKDKKSPLDFKLFTEGMFPLDYISPFVEGQLYDIDGRVGLEDITITGRLNQPLVLGNGNFKGAEFVVDYFKTKYSFDANVNFQPDRIVVDTFKIFDRNQNSANFYGVLNHNGFSDFNLNLQLKQIRNFLVMDTQKEDNELFYGTVYTLDGVASITGALDKLTIDAFLVSGPNTSLKIPLSDDEALERPDFITFVGDKQDDDSNLNTGLEGFDLNLTVQATDQAEVEMIFDERVGDIIRGRGNGTINVRINPEGEFSMTGQYRISQGNYLFTAQNIVNKSFQVREGGTINWTGDPYDAKLALQASYNVNANARDLIGGEDDLPVPVSVLMNLTGELLAPAIGLDLEISNLSEQNVYDLARALQTIRYDEQELNKQVFSLMAFRRFAPLGGGLAEGATVASTGVSSISELLSSQFNYWLSQALGDNVTVGVSTTDFTDLNLLVSAKLFDDRVTIERDGALVSNNSNFSIGNVKVIIKLAPTLKDKEAAAREGKDINSELVLEVFTRESIDQSNNLTNQTGSGVFYKREFNTLREFFKKQK